MLRRTHTSVHMSAHTHYTHTRADASDDSEESESDSEEEEEGSRAPHCVIEEIEDQKQVGNHVTHCRHTGTQHLLKCSAASALLSSLVGSS
jgi:hypothetical protein